LIQQISQLVLLRPESRRAQLAAQMFQFGRILGRLASPIASRHSIGLHQEGGATSLYWFPHGYRRHSNAAIYVPCREAA